MDVRLALRRKILDAALEISPDGMLPGFFVLAVLDPASRSWTPYVQGSTAGYFTSIIDSDPIVETYHGARLETPLGETIIEYRW